MQVSNMVNTVDISSNVK